MKTVEINLIDLRSPATYNEDTAIQAKRQQFDIRNNSVVLFNKSNLKNVYNMNSVISIVPESNQTGI